MPPLALSVVAEVIWGMVVSTLSESTTTWTTLPPALSVRVIATHALSPRLVIWVGAPTTLRSTVVSVLRSKWYLVVLAARGMGGREIGARESDASRAERTSMEYLAWMVGRAGSRPAGESYQTSTPGVLVRDSGGAGRAVSRVLFPTLSRGGWSSVWDGRRRPPRAAYPRLTVASVVGVGHTSPLIWPCSDWGLPCRSLLPGARWALTPPFHPYLTCVRRFVSVSYTH